MAVGAQGTLALRPQTNKVAQSEMPSSRWRAAYSAPELLIGELPVSTLIKQRCVCGASSHHSTAATMTSRVGHYVDVDGDSYGCDADGIKWLQQAQ